MMDRNRHVDNDGKIIEQESPAWVAIVRYCRYQERCHQEARNKLYELGCQAEEVEEKISALISNDILNEERFAIAFAGGRFRIKHWGKTKIRQQLKLKKVSDFCIKKALSTIDADNYEEKLDALTISKYDELKTKNDRMTCISKLYRYLVQKGYENDLVMGAIHEVAKKII